MKSKVRFAGPIDRSTLRKKSPALCLPEGKNKFSNTPALLDVKLAPQNLQLLLWLSILGFQPRLQSFVGVDIPC